MKAAFIGAEVRTAELVTLAVHLRWPDVDPMVATNAAEGLEMVERESPDVVISSVMIGVPARSQNNARTRFEGGLSREK